MTDNYEHYRRALDGFDRVIRQVPDDRWEAQSPCTEWKAIDVAGHVIGVQAFVTSGLTGDAAATAPARSHREVAGDDPVASWGAARAGLEEAAAADGALDRLMVTPFGEMPVDTFLGILVLDALTHTWDLARASGVDDTLDPQLVSMAFERIRPFDAAIRGQGFFGPALEAPPGADEQTQLMAFLGRQA
jgi:uncharacterized protein (TIGR03086 family)